MAVTYGFYDSLNHDRLYNAQQMSAIFDGIINDGVFMSVGNQFHTVAGSGMQVIVKSGRAWFDSTWTLNDAEYPLSIDAADVLLTRIDAVVLEVNSEVATRANTIKVVKGTPASTPAKPTLTNTDTVHQHALAYVTVAKNITAITNSMIEIVVGKTETPYVTAILQTTDITDLFNQWEDYFQTWFDNVRSTLDGDVALNLQNQITTLERSILKGDTKTSMGLPSDAVGDDAFNYLLDKQNKMKTAYSAASDIMILVVDASTTLKIPKNLSTDYFDMIAIGGGGGGGFNYNSNNIYGGGGGGGYTVVTRVKKSMFPDVFTNRELTILVGAGGNGNYDGGDGEDGGDTKVSISATNENLLLAKGGKGGGASTGKFGGNGGDGGSGGGGGGCYTENGTGGHGGTGFTGGGGGGGGGGEDGRSGDGGNGYYGGGGGGGCYTGTPGSGGTGTLGGSGGSGALSGNDGTPGSDMIADNYNDISILNIFYNAYGYHFNEIEKYKSKGGQKGAGYKGYGSGGGGGGGGGFRSRGGNGADGKNSSVGSSGGGGGGYMSSGNSGYYYGNSNGYGGLTSPSGGGGGNMFTLDSLLGTRGRQTNYISSYAGYGSGGRGLGVVIPITSSTSDNMSTVYKEYGVGGDSDYSYKQGADGVVLFIFYIDNKL